MANEELKAKMFDKIEEGEFEVADMADYMTLFCEIANESADVQEEVEDWDRNFRVILDGGTDFWLQIDGGIFEWTPENGSNPASAAPLITLKSSAADAAAIFTGERDATAAYMSGVLKIEGELTDAVKLRSIIEIIREEIEE